MTAGVAALLTEPTTPYTKSNRPFRQFIACEVIPTAAASIMQRRFGPYYQINRVQERPSVRHPMRSAAESGASLPLQPCLDRRFRRACMTR